ncbi:MAG: CheR family methyltransferase [Candidatus Coatesbacteria bacterium]
MTAPSCVAGGHGEILAFLAARAGLVFPPSRIEAVRDGIGRAMARAGAADGPSYLGAIESSPAALDDLVSELVVGETYFFRDPGQFDFLRQDGIPAVLARRPAGHALRIWSAGCATGEEAYSLAILADEMGLSGRSSVVGTDLCRSALVKARRAVYGGWSFRGTGEPLLARFEPDGPRRRVGAALRERVRFEYLNLALDSYPSFAAGIWGMDVILCRNVLIYFSREAVAATARRLHDTLGEDGWLLTGPSDPPLQDLAPFEIVITPGGTAYRRAARRTVVAGWEAVAPVLAESLTAEIPQVACEPRVALPVEPVGAPGIPPAPAEEPDPAARIRGIANLAGLPAALREVEDARLRSPHSVDLAFLRAVVLSELGRLDDAAAEARHALYLDRTLAAAHFLQGTILRRLGDLGGAARAFRNARDLAAGRPPDEPVPLGEGERAGRLAEGAAVQLEMVGAARRVG